jgi:hypothetical protein
MEKEKRKRIETLRREQKDMMVESWGILVCMDMKVAKVASTLTYSYGMKSSGLNILGHSKSSILRLFIYKTIWFCK